jgi:hypothetical protein
MLAEAPESVKAAAIPLFGLVKTDRRFLVAEHRV